jgi:hypothetical protein
MRITEQHLRQIIREALLREGPQPNGTGTSGTTGTARGLVTPEEQRARAVSRLPASKQKSTGGAVNVIARTVGDAVSAASASGMRAAARKGQDTARAANMKYAASELQATYDWFKYSVFPVVASGVWNEDKPIVADRDYTIEFNTLDGNPAMERIYIKKGTRFDGPTATAALGTPSMTVTRDRMTLAQMYDVLEDYVLDNSELDVSMESWPG